MKKTMSMNWPARIIAFIVSLFAASLPVTGTFDMVGQEEKSKKEICKANDCGKEEHAAC